MERTGALNKIVCKQCVNQRRLWNIYDVEARWHWTINDDDRWEKGIVYCNSTNVSPGKCDSQPTSKIPKHCFFAAEHAVSKE